MTPRVMVQPPPDPPSGDWPVPKGFHIEAHERPDRRVATDEERLRKCRRSGCQRTPAMALLRSNGWWLYCDWHTYGSTITDDGRVLSRYVVPDEAEQ